MLPIIGIVIVLGAIAAGYTMEHGSFRVLMQPAELVIIFGAAMGTLVIANPLPVLKKIGKGLAGVFSASRFTKAYYLESLKMLYELFAMSRKAGTAKLEEEVDNPAKGTVLVKYKKFSADHLWRPGLAMLRHAGHGLQQDGPPGRCHPGRAPGAGPGPRRPRRGTSSELARQAGRLRENPAALRRAATVPV